MNPVQKQPNPAAANWLDRAIAMVSPAAAARRLHAKQAFAAMGGYDGARRDGRRKRRTSGIGEGSSDDALLPDLSELREDSYDLWRNAPLARGAVNTQITNVVGVGLRVQSTMDREILRTRLKLTEEQIDAAERAAEREFRLWASSKDASVDRSLRFDEQQVVVLAESLLGGDCFVIPRYIERQGVALALANQIIPAARILNPGFKTDTPELTAGVEKDGWGAPIAYHVSKFAPGSPRFRSTEFERLPAFSERTGRRLVRHICRRVLSTQTRGEPYLAPIIGLLEDLKDYSKNELRAAVVSSLFTVFIKRANAVGYTGENTSGTFDTKNADREVLELGSGAVAELGPGESIETATPGRPNTAFDPFVLAVLRQIGVALELPLEVLIKHFTASYSAAQAAIMEAWKAFRSRSAWLAQEFCQPIYEDVIWEAAARGRLSLPGFFGDALLRQAYLGTRWVPPPRLQIRQDQEISAAERRVDLGISTLAAETAELTGADWEVVHAQRTKEHRMRVADGLEAPITGTPAAAPPSTKPATVLDDKEDQP